MGPSLALPTPYCIVLYSSAFGMRKLYLFRDNTQGSGCLLERGLISEHGLISSDENQLGAADGQDSLGVFQGR